MPLVIAYLLISSITVCASHSMFAENMVDISAKYGRGYYVSLKNGTMFFFSGGKGRRVGEDSDLANNREQRAG